MRLMLCVVAALVMAAFVNGCATQPKINWNARIGNYTYNQAAKDLGVPDRYQKLSDNSIVAEWAWGYYTPEYAAYAYPGGYWGRGWSWAGMGYGYPIGPEYSSWLRLVFGPDGKLTMFKKYYR